MTARSKPKAASPATEARQAEADDGFVTVEQAGVTVRVPVGGKVPLAAIDAFRANDNYGGLRELLGKEQWQKLRDAGATKDDLEELDKKLKDASGN